LATTKQKVLIATVFAAVLGLIYVGWNYHEANVAQKQAMGFVGGPPDPYISGLYKRDPKIPPPPQY
jgi:hypothetical protein